MGRRYPMAEEWRGINRAGQDSAVDKRLKLQATAEVVKRKLRP